MHILDHGKVAYSDTISGMQGARGEQVIDVEFKTPPSEEWFSMQGDGIAMEKTPSGGYRITHPSVDPTDMVVRASVENGWGLFKLNQVQASLERSFCSTLQRLMKKN